jgi:hypothetical protein
MRRAEVGAGIGREHKENRGLMSMGGRRYQRTGQARNQIKPRSPGTTRSFPSSLDSHRQRQFHYFRLFARTPGEPCNETIKKSECEDERIRNGTAIGLDLHHLARITFLQGRRIAQGIEGNHGDGGLVGRPIYALVNSILFRYLLIRIVICLSSLGLCLYALIVF